MHLPDLRGRRRLFVLAVLLPTVLAVGCAKSPTTGGVGVVTNRLLVQFSVDGGINDLFYYFVAFDDDDNPADGPLPVISSPWGNGWGTGSFTRFVEYHQGVFRVLTHTVNDDGTVDDEYVDRPFQFTFPQGGKELSFVLDYAKNFPSDPRTLDINIITTDEIILDPNLQIEKTFDALGPRGNDYVSIQTQTNGVFTNQTAAIREEAGDVSRPDLDLIDWRIEIQRQ